MVFTVFVELAGLISLIYQINNVILFNLYLPLQAILFAWFYRKEGTLRRMSNIINWFIVVFPALVILNGLTLQYFATTFQSYTYLGSSVFMILLAVMYFYELFTNPKLLDVNILRVPFFWVSTGILFYFSGAFLWAAYVNFLITADYTLAGSISRITTILASLMYTLFAIGFSCHKLFRTSPSS